MQIAEARTQAARHINQHLIESRAKRPPQGAAVMCRYPDRGGDLVLADDTAELREKLARKIQYRARRANARSH